MDEKIIFRYTLIKERLGGKTLNRKEEGYGKSENVREDGYQESSSEDCFKEDGGKKDCKEDGGHDGRKQLHLRSLRPHRHCRHCLRLR